MDHRENHGGGPLQDYVGLMHHKIALILDSLLHRSIQVNTDLIRVNKATGRAGNSA